MLLSHKREAMRDDTYTVPQLGEYLDANFLVDMSRGLLDQGTKQLRLQLPLVEALLQGVLR